MTTAIEKPTGIKGWGVANDQLTMTQRWVSLVSMMITGVAVVFIVMKWNPILAIVGAEYGMDMSSIGNISGLALFMGCIVCFPAVWIMRNIGVKFTLALSIVITLAGSIMSLCVDTAGLFLAARVIEGAGMGMLAAAGPNIIPRLFPLQKMGLAMGVWSQWTVTGLLAAIFVGSRLYASTGDTATVTYLGIGLLVAALIVHCVAFRLCAVDENVLNAQAAQAQQKTAISRNYVRAGIICAFCFFGYCWIFGLCQGFYPTFLQSLGMGVVESNNPATIAQIIVVLVGVSLGVLLEKVPLRKVCSAGGLILFGGMVILSFNDFGNASINAWLYTFGIGLLAGVVPVAIRMYVPFLVTDPKKMDYVLGIMAFVTNLTFFGNGLFGALIAQVGFFNAALLFLGIPLVICTVLILVFVKSDRKILKEEASE
ncbi:MAG: MFS transporter [Eggerthellaceae bacterium]|nr:MFS transporter [Eggerthellaceae bacterium]